jgi:hypothetical protein
VVKVVDNCAYAANPKFCQQKKVWDASPPPSADTAYNNGYVNKWGYAIHFDLMQTGAAWVPPIADWDGVELTAEKLDDCSEWTCPEGSCTLTCESTS